MQPPLEAVRNFARIQEPATKSGGRVDVKVVRGENGRSARIELGFVTSLLDLGPPNSKIGRQQRSIAGAIMPINQPSADMSAISRPVVEPGEPRTSPSSQNVSFSGLATPHSTPLISPRRCSVYYVNAPSWAVSHYMKGPRAGNAIDPFRNHS